MILLALHAFMFSLIGVLGVCLQLKFPDVSTYATAYGTVMMDLIIIETCFYMVSLVVMGILAARNNTDYDRRSDEQNLPLTWKSVPDFRVAHPYFTIRMDCTLLLDHLPFMLRE
ncbi:hypothetical protein RchiOBHm_Chr2g0166831 [Rosa chinensis]|uniref:Uncharacterized protein n=1 Tax=Rosa chinensis TaxID=74649 RepID=A0A2P6S469_ROSCH|nr:hypothetical protein RchiOBHm_Chr2g0166831 [Rosa chinensis]